MIQAPHNNRALLRAGQFTALVDILFATIGIFVIVFALQKLEPPADLRPAPFDALLACPADRVLQLHRKNGEKPTRYGPRDISGKLADELRSGGRVLVAISKECASDTGDGIVMIDRLHDLERKLTEHDAGEKSPLLLLEFAPLAADGTNRLVQRFTLSAGEK